MQTLHALEIFDMSGDITDRETLLFRTERGARGWAARVGTLHGYRSFKLNGKSIGIDQDDAPFAEDTVGSIYRGITRIHAAVA